MKNKSIIANIAVVAILVSVFFVCGIHDAQAFASVKAPAKVKRLAVVDDESYVSELISFSDLHKPWNKVKVLGISRTAAVSWKTVKGASGYKVYMSYKGPKKGYKCVGTVSSRWARKGVVTSDPVTYKGAKKARVWFRVRAYKKKGKKIRYGKYSGPLEVVLLQRPIIKSVSGTDNKVTVKWKKVYYAKQYEVLYATSEDMAAYREKYNSEHKNRQLPAKHYESLLATAHKTVTTGTSCTLTLPEEGNYIIHVRAVNGKNKSSINYDYEYYNWWTEE